mmetsp:Transcript_18283/g.24107  ORF Transcript_18283/g.24107 Transcript_18283/m.24107 type:complete len:683 (+) Transcript_18283:476-2524(+)
MGCGVSTPKQVLTNNSRKSSNTKETPINGNADSHYHEEKLKTLHEKRQSQRFIQNLVTEHVGMSVHDVYDTAYGHTLGSGISGTVRQVRHKKTSVEYAMKTLSKGRVRTEKKMQDLRNEIRVMSEVDHPNIIRLMDVFETEHHIFLIIELCTGGELLQRLQSQPHYHYSEITASQILRKITSAVKYLHNQRIVHRDLKLENFLFENKSPTAELKLIDFGFSQHFQESEELSVPVGTPFYVAPEVLRGSYNHKCDMWSIGVITYMLLSGRPAFYGENQREILEAVKRGKFEFPDEIFKFVSPLAKDFISKLLVIDPVKRLSAEECQQHAWLSLHTEKPEAEISPEVVESLKDFQKYSKLKRVALEVIAYSLRPEQIQLLREEFSKLDQTESGEITFEDFRKACTSSGFVKPGDLQLIFESVDIGQTGKIHWLEFLAATMQKSMLDEEAIKVAFGRIDVAKRGYITSQELKQLVGIDMTEQQVNEMIEEIDSANGKLTCEQFVELIKGSTTANGTSRRFLFWNFGPNDLFRRMSVSIRSRLSSESGFLDDESFIGRLRMKSKSTSLSSSNLNGNRNNGSSPKKSRTTSFRYKKPFGPLHRKSPPAPSHPMARNRRMFTSPEHENFGSDSSDKQQYPAGKRVQTCPDVDLLPVTKMKVKEAPTDIRPTGKHKVQVAVSESGEDKN